MKKILLGILLFFSFYATSQEINGYYSGIPYTGANQAVNLGAQTFSAGKSTFNNTAPTIIGEQFTTYGSVHLGIPLTSTTTMNALLYCGGVTGNDAYFNAPSDSGSVTITKNLGSYFIQCNGDKSNSILNSIIFRPSNRPNMTAGQNVPQFFFNSVQGTKTWKTGAIASDWNFYIESPNYRAVAASVLTNAYTQWNAIPVQSTNMTITNKWGFGTAGSAHVTQSLVIGQLARTPLATLDLAGTFSASSTSSLSGLQLVSGGYSVTAKVINTTSGDAATINSPVGRFRKDNSGTVFTLTNNQITANSIIVLQRITAGLTGGTEMTVQAGAGSATITFEVSATGAATAPSADMDVNFIIMN